MLTEINEKGKRIEKLEELARILAERIDLCEDEKLLPQLSKQYRETIRDIAEIEPDEGDTEIDELIKDCRLVR